ncbi:4'-phosphopantetheinyl transferase family protein [Xanthobacter sp. AM11]|uniref:4'-phosphopantetheinyl transferase family protein n=1 Tax=Xanthobacter sp. AM11 TaxID=3380643 RepID=UPI0039BF94BA
MAVAGLDVPPLGPGESLVAAARVADLAQDGAFAFALPPPDEARIARFVHGPDRAARRTAWRLARLLAGAVLRQPPALLEIRRDARGRPHLAGGHGLDLNLSHGGGWVAVGLARGGRIGVDVEGPRPPALWQDLARFFLGGLEHAAWSALPPHAQPAAALSLWCRKEAVLKATGEGLAGDARTVRLPPGDGIHHRQGLALHVAALDLPAAAPYAPGALPACLAFAVEGTRPPLLLLPGG